MSLKNPKNDDRNFVLNEIVKRKILDMYKISGNSSSQKRETEKPEQPKEDKK